ncbi:class I SAM-dependent methyltransferase [Neomoorella thermoacetica]|uniref:class I SAM-dependent methyltransferase n=1 Tax=Neomoorella thermoacetica TaxID=1525 RepID=UPI000039B71B|nr:class I SAM-dependent methyltransferase [Moorella thermoacetica]OIQ56315.1 demethylrebeccamycin-D-glucose O-methyltransferase [Moorella thermoacetica]OIQ57756.1 demethylrebeccamycin-D-glucose O-methyltransferase [Moorella thermoacetica]QDA00400.1 Demethylrebeccamycin-D-glucose O-methyltransferase [Moorella thermoacetica]TYL12171.1 Ubiquinone/menaquinone biosynthesis C-methyltransferase UbiE [Moorella thermoacetica]TYL17101.1 Ubiquinone/menaquinone biosynthesis C-methyltransferase UbiE [Moor
MAEIFDRKAGDYDDWYTRPLGALVDRVEKEPIYAYLDPHAGEHILDVGCGTGNFSLELARRGVKVTGIDISDPMLAKARKKAADAGLAIEFLHADAMNLPFGDNTFDKIVSVTALEFAPELKAVLEESYRVLKPGGRMVIGLIGGNSLWSRHYEARAAREPDCLFRYARFYTLDELLAAMPGKNVQGKAVLFFGPDFDGTKVDEALAIEAAAAREGRTNGGFITAVSYKD